MAEDVEKRGIIRTMDDDLSRAHGGTDLRMPPKPKETPEAEMVSPPPAPAPAPSKPAPISQEAPVPVNAPVPPAPPTPPRAPKTPYMGDEELDKLLPLEDTPADATRLSDDMPPGSHESVVRALPNDHEPMRPASTPQKPAPTAPSRDLEGEIFPEPEIKKDFTETPVPTPLGDAPPPNLPTEEGALPTPPPPPPAPSSDDEELPAETPEEILGISDAGGGTVSPPPAMSPAASAPSSSRKIIAGVVALALVAAAAGGAYYWFFVRSAPAPPAENTTPPVQVPEANPPDALISPDFQQIITVGDFNGSTLRATLANLGARSYPSQSITYAPVRTVVNEQYSYIDAQTFLAALGIPTPSTLPDVVEGGFMLAMYGAGGDEQTLCAAAGITESSCWGPRLALVLHAREGKSAELVALSEQWRAEGEGGLKNLILSTTQSSPSADFLQDTYTDTGITTPVYYKNFPISTTTIDMAVVDDMLIVATSKNALFALIAAANTGVGM